MRGASEHPDLPTYKMCAVTDVAVNYTLMETMQFTMMVLQLHTN